MRNMKRFTLITSTILFAMLICSSCKKEETENFESKLIDGLTLDNYPRVDGSTSTLPLNVVIACELLGISHEPYQAVEDDSWGIKPNLNNKANKKFEDKVKSTGTHQSFINLINKETDLILTARKMSSDEKKHADAMGVSLIETPIALDAFVFIVNPLNPVQSLTIEQIQDIYTGKITHWEEVGGDFPWPDYGKINPYVRNANSGSQELMEELVMKGLDMIEYPQASELMLHSMAGPTNVIFRDINALCYTVYYYLNYIQKGLNVNGIAVDGVIPHGGSIYNKTYPYVTEVYAVIRSDLNNLSMPYKIYEFLQTEKGRNVVRKSGYLPH